MSELIFRIADMDEPRRFLPAYFSVRHGDRKAGFLLAKQTYPDVKEREPIELTTQELWEVHAEGIKAMREARNSFDPRSPSGNDERGPSLLDIKIELARRTLGSCELCEHRCGIDRTRETGWCGVREPRLSSEFLHTGEEPELVPSHTFFLSGCTFGCVFCQNHDISQNPMEGGPVKPEYVVGRIEARVGSSVNVNWVGGDPTSNLPFILEVLDQLRSNVAQVWNSNMYLTPSAMSLLDGVVDLYLTDFKYGNSKCARLLSKVDDYWKIATRNHMEANRQCEMIIRHLVMPGHVECCTEPIMRFIAEQLDTSGLRVNVMGQYRPCYEAHEYEGMNRRPTTDEMERSMTLAKELGLSLCD